jgi:hypothetical protein
LGEPVQEVRPADGVLRGLFGGQIAVFGRVGSVPRARDVQCGRLLALEGYAVIIGATLILQGLLTLRSLYARRPPALGRTAPIW